jgi:hypothetical protein
MIFGEEASQPKGPPHTQVRFDMSQMETAYANAFAVAGSPDEIVLYVGANLPMPNVNEPVVRVSHRLTLLPGTAKRLMMVLQQTIKAHEERFGPIELAPPPRRPEGPNP